MMSPLLLPRISYLPYVWLACARTDRSRFPPAKSRLTAPFFVAALALVLHRFVVCCGLILLSKLLYHPHPNEALDALTNPR